MSSPLTPEMDEIFTKQFELNLEYPHSIFLQYMDSTYTRIQMFILGDFTGLSGSYITMKVYIIWLPEGRILSEANKTGKSELALHMLWQSSNLNTTRVTALEQRPHQINKC